jgi:hypothetical protein
MGLRQLRHPWAEEVFCRLKFADSLHPAMALVTHCGSCEKGELKAVVDVSGGLPKSEVFVPHVKCLVDRPTKGPNRRGNSG